MCPASKWPQSDLLKASLTEARVTSVCPINILNCPNVNIRFSWIYSNTVDVYSLVTAGLWENPL